MKTYQSWKQTESYEIETDDGEDNETPEPESLNSYDQDYYPTFVSVQHLITQSDIKELNNSLGTS